MAKRKTAAGGRINQEQKTQREKVPEVQTAGRAKRKEGKKAGNKVARKNQRTGKETQNQKIQSGKIRNKETESTQEEKELEIQINNLKRIASRVEQGLLPIWTMDIETDPFKRNNIPLPFVIGLYDGVVFRKFWSDKKSSCVEKVRQFLEDCDPAERGIVYMHNGGRFDFFYLLDWFEGKTVIMGSRIVKAIMQLNDSHNKNNQWEFRDSYAIMPFPLKAYKKDDIDINKMHKSVRHKHVEEIESYLKGDCAYLWELCMEFQKEFGDYLTIASAAFAQLSSMHKFERLPQSQDSDLRKKFYYGGRVQCFKKGIVEQPINIYDVNSMYPSVMRNFWHPTSWCSLIDRQIRWSNSCAWNNLRTFFITASGKNYGAFPVRQKDGSIDFTVERGIFHVSIHEWNTAIELGLFIPDSIIATYNFNQSSKFFQFVEHFFNARRQAKSNNDSMRTLFYKYILNSAYGKFALNPENYYSWEITRKAEPPDGKQAWVLDSMVQGKYYVWKAPNTTKSWNLYNIATAASITGAARSILLRAIATAKNVIYCDTDSIICESLSGQELDDKKLGAWKHEGTGNLAAVAGKKMYAIFNGTECIKHANKGVSLDPMEIVQICKGQDVITYRDAPTFKRDGSAKFVERTVRMT